MSSYLELFWSAFFPHFPAFGLNTERYGAFSPNAGKCGKDADQNISLYTDSFYAAQNFMSKTGIH